MIAAAAVLIVVLVPAVWFFVGVQPRTTRTFALRCFNAVTLLLAACSVVAISLYSWLTTGHSVDSGWWPVVAVLGSGLCIGVVLILAIVVRFFVFRPVSPK